MSESLQTILISGGVSIIVAIITAIITSKLSIRQEEKKSIYAKRESAYIALFDLLNSLQDNQYIIFNQTDFVKPLSVLRTKLNLFASQDALDIFEPFYQKIKKTAIEYWNKFEGEEYENYKSNRIQYDNATELDLLQEEELYQKDHLLNSTEVNQTIEDLVIIMRKDMGTM